MLFEICNVLCDRVSSRLSLEYSIDVTLKNPIFKWNQNQNSVYLGPQLCLGGEARRKSLVFEFQICQCYNFICRELQTLV